MLTSNCSENDPMVQATEVEPVVTLEGSPDGNLALLETQMLWLWVWNRCSHRVIPVSQVSLGPAAQSFDDYLVSSYSVPHPRHWGAGDSGVIQSPSLRACIWEGGRSLNSRRED